MLLVVLSCTGSGINQDSACLMTYPAMSACCLLCAELHAAAAKPALRAEGVLQRISGQLLQQVPFTVLQAQVRGCGQQVLRAQLLGVHLLIVLAQTSEAE